MFDDLKKHPLHFSILFLWLVLVSAIFLLLPADFVVRQTVVVLGVFGYVAWGIWHHMVHKDLSFPIVLEYLLTGMLALVVVTFVLYNT